MNRVSAKFLPFLFTLFLATKRYRIWRTAAPCGPYTTRLGLFAPVSTLPFQAIMPGWGEVAMMNSLGRFRSGMANELQYVRDCYTSTEWRISCRLLTHSLPMPGYAHNDAIDDAVSTDYAQVLEMGLFFLYRGAARPEYLRRRCCCTEWSI